ncbi:MAG: hypothetical protein Q9228_006431 [Teloschistes exilis]
MIYLAVLVATLAASSHAKGLFAEQDVLDNGIDPERYKAACPDYRHYAMMPHRPLSKGPLALPYQRPAPNCRTFTSSLVEKVIEDMTSKMEDKDLARIFENAFPNTLDTTVRWHVDGRGKKAQKYRSDEIRDEGHWDGAQSFIVTGDINAEWLRDSTSQLAQYQSLAKNDNGLKSLILGAINTQAEFVIESPYCNAFQPPPPSGVSPTSNGQDDSVHPAYEPSSVFECKYEIDSLAQFLALGNKFYNNTGSKEFLHRRWYLALDTLLEVLHEQAKPTFDEKTGRFDRNEYQFRRRTNLGTETLSLGGIGHPLNGGTGLIRSAFRPSDDATILGFFIPGNALMSVELKRTAEMLKAVGKTELAKKAQARSENITKGIWEHGVVTHKKYGEVFAFEVDGYGSSIIMDDANIPSLLALPAMGFVDRSDKVYQNTRKMILERAGNPYYLDGRSFAGIGGPHVGLEHAWPMSRLVQAMTSDDDDEIIDSLDLVKRSSRLGLIHESIHVERMADYTREQSPTSELCRFPVLTNCRELVRMGELGVCTDDFGYCGEETPSAIRQGGGDIQGGIDRTYE